MKLSAFVAGAICTCPLVALTATPASAATAVECSPTERTIFACEAASKRLAVCAATALTPTAGTLQYRFGKPAGLELAYPAVDDDWRSLTRGGVLSFSGGGGAFLAFTRYEYRYVVYTAGGRGWAPRAGVVVEHQGRRIANVRCTAPAVSVIGPELFSSAGIPLTEDFDLP
jgi:hypothetical protein